MKLPRDVDGSRLVRALKVLGYEAGRQSGSHVRLTTQRNGENHEVIPHTAQSKPALWRRF